MYRYRVLQLGIFVGEQVVLSELDTVSFYARSLASSFSCVLYLLLPVAPHNRRVCIFILTI